MKQLLNHARIEILQLRRQNEILAAKVSVINVFEAALLGPRTSGGMAPDIVYELERKIEELEQKKAPPEER